MPVSKLPCNMALTLNGKVDKLKIFHFTPFHLHFSTQELYSNIFVLYCYRPQ